MKEIILIPTSKIKESNYRDSGSINDLVESMLEIGLIQPITVKPQDDTNFAIIDGHRRYQAHMVAFGTEMSIECIVDADESNKALIKKMCANFNRRDPSFKETADFIKTMVDSKKKNHSAKAIAKASGVPVEQIKAYYTYANLSEEQQKDVNRYKPKQKFMILNLDKESLDEFFDSSEWTQDRAVKVKDLVNAPFDLNDATLHPQGACSSCPFNTNNFGSLFGGSGTCIKTSCYFDKSLTFAEKIAENNPYTVSQYSLNHNHEMKDFVDTYPNNFIHPDLMGRIVDTKVNVADLEQIYRVVNEFYDDSECEDPLALSLESCDTDYERYIVQSYIEVERHLPVALKQAISEVSYYLNVVKTNLFSCYMISLPDDITKLFYVEPLSKSLDEDTPDGIEHVDSNGEVTVGPSNEQRLAREILELEEEMHKLQVKLERNKELEYYKSMDEQVSILRTYDKSEFNIVTVFNYTDVLERYKFMLRVLDTKLATGARKYIRLRLGIEETSSEYNLPSLDDADFSSIQMSTDAELHEWFGELFMIASFHHMISEYSIKAEKNNHLAIYFDNHFKNFITSDIQTFYRDMYKKRNTTIGERMVAITDRIEFLSSGVNTQQEDSN